MRNLWEVIKGAVGDKKSRLEKKKFELKTANKGKSALKG